MDFRVGAMAPSQPPLAPEVKLGDGDGDGGGPLGPIRAVAGFDRGEVRGGKRKRRERQPNWETSEMFALVKAKKAEHDEHNVPGGDLVRWCNRERGSDTVHKWPKIAASVWNEGASVVFRNSESCKDKWGQLQGEYKKIRDYEKGRLAAGDQRAYWDLRAAERQALHLPKTFHNKRLYERMDEFLNENPPPTPRLKAFHPNAVLREHTGAVSRSPPSDTPANIIESSNPAVVFPLHPTEVIASPVEANLTRELRPSSAHRSHPASTTQRQKHVEETEVAAAIRDRLARLRERILASEAESPDTERISAGDAGSPEMEAVGSKDGAVLLKWSDATGKQYECIQAAIVGDGTVGLITLDRPAALNALSHALMLELADALQALDATKQVGAIVLTGKGEAFSAGIDIKEMKETTLVDAYASRFARHLNAVTAIRKPIIAAVNGYAVAGGGELAMMCDIILAGERAQFGQPEINLGTIPGMGGSQRLIREVGKSRAMEMILTGKHFMNAHEAARRGLVSRVVPGDDEMLVAEAISLGREIAQKSKPVVALAKETVNTAYEMGLTEGVKKEQLLFYATFGLEDQKEGMTAFLEKRSAVFKDR